MDEVRWRGPTPRVPFIVLTGGPGSGKTAIRELARERFDGRVRVLPESASILFGGGFPRDDEVETRRAGQRLIYRIQSELEHLAEVSEPAAAVLCDRGTLDGLAYWQQSEDAFFDNNRSSRAHELGRYHTVIHLGVPASDAYCRANPVRIENHDEALDLDKRIEAAWSGHPRRHFVGPTADFLDKASQVLDLIETALQSHARSQR